MNISKNIFSTLLALIFSCPIIASASTYYVADVSSESADSQLKASVKDLLKAALYEHGESVANEKAEADYVITSNVIVIGSSTIVSIQKQRHNEILYTDKLKASSLNELDVIVDRLVSALVSQQKAAQNPEIGKITDEEITKVSRRTKAQKFRFVAIGPFAFTDLSTDAMAYYFASGFIADVTPNNSIKMEFELSARIRDLGDENSRSAFLYSGNLGGIHYFSTKNTSTFVSGSFGFGSAYSSETENNWSFTLGTELGIAFFRTATSQMQIGLKYTGLTDVNGIGHPGHVGVFLRGLY